MQYILNKKKINIPDTEIEKSMRLLEITKDEAIQMWLEDEGYLENEEQEKLCEKAKENRVTATIHDAGNKTKRKPSKPKTEEKKKGFICTICGYIYEGDTLPDDFICPLCKHPASDFEPLP